MRVTVLLVFCLGVSGLSLGGEKPASKPRPPLTQSVVTWLQAGFTSGKMTEKEIVAKLGRPDRIEVDLDQVDAVTEFIYVDINWIDVDFKNGKVVRVGGSFSAPPTEWQKKLTLAALGQVKKDMREGDVRKALGVGGSEDTKQLEDGITRHT